jgi:hypothetical protein
MASESVPNRVDVRSVAPALEKYAHGPLADLWNRPDLDRRDRSIVIVAALIARNDPVEFPFYLGTAIDNGVATRGHFKKYKAATEKMIKSMKLVQTTPVILGDKAR